ncbi:MAG: amino acid adenylation domain-containing protein, partial [bacterium]|nr:amino acid adenylation domain-containing protein [bacterium]
MKNKNYSVDVEAIASQYVKEENYWLNKLSGDLVKSGFPYDGPGKNTDEQEKRERVALQLDGEVFQKLNQLSNGSDIRLFMILAAALNVLLSVYSGEKDILIGAPIMKQDVEAEFVNTVLVLRNILGDTMSFKELLLQMRQCVTEAVDNVNYPLETLLYKLEGGRSGDDNTQLSSQENFPLFDTALLIENIQNMDYIRHISLNTVFSFLRTDTDIAGHLSYNPRLYRRETAQRIGGHFKHLVEYLVFNINAPVHMPDFLPDEEKELLVNGFNNTRREYPASKTLSELFEEQAAATPERFALKGGTCGGHGTVDDTLPEGGDTGSQAQLTYSQLNCKANQLASHLLQKGVRADTIVGIMTERSVEMIIGILGVLKAGGAYLPLDPDHPENRTAYMLKSSGVHVLLKQSTISGNFKDRCEVIDLDSNEWCRGSAENPGIKGNPRDLAYVIFTSGSTGNPKGVLVENRSVVNLIHWYARVIDVKANPNFVLLSSFTFDAGIEDIFTSLLMGGTLHVPGKDTILDREQFIKYVNGNRINSLNFVPTALKELLEDEEKPGSLDVIVSGGEELSGPLKDRFLDKGYRLYNSYGPTETTVDALLDKCSDKGVSLGKPMDNASVYILDKTGRHLLPIGINGELCISGLGVARGYLNNPELTAEKFIPNPYVSSMSLPDTLIYRTGDLARRLPDGNIEFSGRIDNQVKVRGFRIELGEIESRLLALGEIKEAVVSAKEEADGSKYLCAYIVKREAVGNIGRYRGGVGHNSKGPEDFSGIKEKLAAELPEYMVPAHFVCLDKMPLTPGGKLDKKALPEPEIAAGKDYIAPRTELEKKLVEIWAEILNSETSVIGINANFFDMGGHSL